MAKTRMERNCHLHGSIDPPHGIKNYGADVIQSYEIICRLLCESGFIIVKFSFIMSTSIVILSHGSTGGVTRRFEHSGVGNLGSGSI